MDHKLPRVLAESREAKRPDARIAKSRRALHSALLELVLENPFEEVTIAAIAARAKIGYATFFRHYASREALLSEIADGLIGELLVLIVPLVRARDTRAASAALAGFVDARRPLCRALLVGAGDAMRRDITARAVMAAGAAETAPPQWLPRDLGAIHGVAATLTVLRWWLEHPTEKDADGVAEIIDKLVFSPLAHST